MTNSSAGGDHDDHARRYADVVFILVGTTHPGNIGASARAMKAMGFSGLRLVAPKTFPAAAATAMASGADDLLANATVHANLADAIGDCTLVIGTTARDRHLEWPVRSPRAAAIEVAAGLEHGRVALVFGRERSGLSNAELDLCQHAIRIPTNPAFSSLNLAQAVQVCAYELREALGAQALAGAAAADPADPPATAAEVERLYRHLIDSMVAVGYHDPANPRLLERRIRRLLNRTGLFQSETQILRGFLSAVERYGRGGGDR